MKGEITIVDPWGKSGLDEYVESYTDALLKIAPNVRIITNYFSTINPKQRILLKKKFFRYSEKITKFKYLRLFIRGIEYSYTQLKIAFLIKSNIIHFQWFLYPAIDLLVIRYLKLRGKQVYYTAHNSKPHNSTVSLGHIKLLKEVDLIFVHGKRIKNEIRKYGIKESKIVVIPHGSKHKYVTPNHETKPRELKRLVFNRDNHIFLFFGLINPNKGVLELLEMWDRITNCRESLTLIVAGKINPIIRKEILSHKNNAFIIDRFVSNEELAYLINRANLVLMPYKNGSVSGVLFTAAAFKKPILTTDFGSISDYVVNNKTSFLERNLQGFEQKLIKLSNLPVDSLNEIGYNNYSFIKEKCSVSKISQLIKKHYA